MALGVDFLVGDIDALLLGDDLFVQTSESVCTKRSPADALP